MIRDQIKQIIYDDCYNCYSESDIEVITDLNTSCPLNEIESLALMAHGFHLPCFSNTKEIEIIEKDEVWDQDKGVWVEQYTWEEKAKAFKKLVNLDSQDLIFLIPNWGYGVEHPFHKDNEIRNAFTNAYSKYINNYKLGDYRINKRGGELTLLTDVFAREGNIDSLFDLITDTRVVNIKLVKSVFFNEKQKRGEDLTPYLKTIPPSSPLWREIPITYDFLQALSPVKRLKFLSTVEVEVECSYDEIKRLIFPLYDNPKHRERVNEVLTKYRHNYRSILTNRLLEDSSSFDYCMVKFNSFLMSEIVDFFKDEFNDSSGKVIKQFIDYYLRSSPPMAAKALMDSVRCRIDGENKRAKKNRR